MEDHTWEVHFMNDLPFGWNFLHVHLVILGKSLQVGRSQGQHVFSVLKKLL